MFKNQNRFLAWMTFLFLTFNAILLANEYKGPIDLIPSKDGQTLYVLNMDAKEIAFVPTEKLNAKDPSQFESVIDRTIPLPQEPHSMALANDEKTMFVSAGYEQGKIYAVDLESGTIKAEGQTGHTPMGIVLSTDQQKIYVCYRFNHCVAEIDAATLQELRRFPTLNEPVDTVVTLDGKTVYAANFLPHDPSNGADVAAEITSIDTETGNTKNIRLPNGSSSMHGITLSPDGKYVYTTAILARYPLPTTQLERGWMNTNGFSIIDAEKREFINTVLLDDVDLGAANPWPIITSPDGTKVYVGLAGTHELCVVEIDKTHEKLNALPKDEEEAKATRSTSTITANQVPQLLAFLVGLKKRIKLSGKAPRSLATIDNKVYCGMYYSDSICVIDMKARRPKAKEFPLGPKPDMTPERQGELYWNDATLCFQHWQSCASCHPDARTDALNWDLLNDGTGNHKNAKSLLFSVQTPPAMWHGVRETAEYAIRTGFRYILFAERPEDEYLKIDAYIKAMQPLQSPYLVNGELSESAKRGKELFESERIGCLKCHFGEFYTDLKMHDVGSKAPEYDHMDEFDTPTLREVWRTSPYMHDGRYVDMRDVFKEGNHGDVYGDISEMTDQEIDDLVEYVMSL
ncbi:MAG: c-type cytochrome [Planctomycetia bacterium]|nr:c-type cytochrome [Planctomycetia bacterium]